MDFDFNKSYEEFKEYYDTSVAWMLLDDTFPLWLGEFGTNTSDNYWQYLVRYFAENPNLHWAYWAYNGYKADPSEDETYGIVDIDMVTVRDQWKLQDL